VQRATDARVRSCATYSASSRRRIISDERRARAARSKYARIEASSSSATTISFRSSSILPARWNIDVDAGSGTLLRGVGLIRPATSSPRGSTVKVRTSRPSHAPRAIIYARSDRGPHLRSAVHSRSVRCLACFRLLGYPAIRDTRAALRDLRLSVANKKAALLLRELIIGFSVVDVA